MRGRVFILRVKLLKLLSWGLWGGGLLGFGAGETEFETGHLSSLLKPVFDQFVPISEFDGGGVGFVR
jgi:hypothetical protein